MNERQQTNKGKKSTTEVKYERSQATTLSHSRANRPKDSLFFIEIQEKISCINLIHSKPDLESDLPVGNGTLLDISP